MISPQERICIDAISEIIATFKHENKIDAKLAKVLVLHAQYLERETSLKWGNKAA